MRELSMPGCNRPNRLTVTIEVTGAVENRCDKAAYRYGQSFVRYRRATGQGRLPIKRQARFKH